jgi:glycosyltransferase involved in cell wall biosynthesis
VNRTIIQTSKNKPEALKSENLTRFAGNWEHLHFDDSEIIQFFKDNPIPGFENVEKRFYELPRGEFRADLFRYYYIYLNGGFFVDLDFELKENLDSVVENYEFVTAELKSYETGAWGNTYRSRAFNGYMYAANPKHPIVFQCLQHLYHIDTSDLGPADGGWDSRYHLVCEYFYNVIQAYPDKDKIKIYRQTDEPTGAFIVDGTRILGQHFPASKDSQVTLGPGTVFGNNPVLFFCELTSATTFNSGIQRHVKQMAKAMLDIGINLIPVKLGRGNTLELIGNRELNNFATYDGPRLDQWIYTRNSNNSSIDRYLNDANYMIYAELPRLDGKQTMRAAIKHARRNGIKVISVFHDAVAVILNRVYNQRTSANFTTYMQDLSNSNAIIHVSDSSMSDYHKLLGKTRTNQRSVVLKSPHNIDPDKYFKPKENNTNDINILSIISFEERKNHLSLMEAFNQAKKSLSDRGYNLNLRIISAYKGNDVYYNKVVALASKLGVELSIGVTDQELMAAYETCDFTVYPSLYEGFGLPIVESLKMSRPVACSNTSSMKEVAELGGCHLFDPNDVNHMASAIIEMASNEELRNKLTMQIKDITPYSWESYAKDFVKIINGAIPQSPWTEIN